MPGLPGHQSHGLILNETLNKYPKSAAHYMRAGKARGSTQNVLRMVIFFRLLPFLSVSTSLMNITIIYHKTFFFAVILQESAVLVPLERTPLVAYFYGAIENFPGNRTTFLLFYRACCSCPARETLLCCYNLCACHFCPRKENSLSAILQGPAVLVPLEEHPITVILYGPAVWSC